jgi:hypothetical protein
VDRLCSLKGTVQSLPNPLPCLWLETGEREHRKRGLYLVGWQTGYFSLSTHVTVTFIEAKVISFSNYSSRERSWEQKDFFLPEQPMFRSERRLVQCKTALVIRFHAQARCLMIPCVHKSSPLLEGRAFLRGPMPNTVRTIL